MLPQFGSIARSRGDTAGPQRERLSRAPNRTLVHHGPAESVDQEVILALSRGLTPAGAGNARKRFCEHRFEAICRR